MASSNSVFRLIKSLTPSEKRYFKVFAQRHVIGEEGENNYVLLFNALGRQKEYDEAALLKQFQNKNFVKRMDRIKNYLFEIIVKSLHSFHSESSVKARLSKLLHIAEILYAKSLYEECRKILKKARRIAQASDIHTSLIEINGWEYSLAWKEKKINPKQIEKIIQRKERALSLLVNSNQYKILAHKMELSYQSWGTIRKKGELKEMQSLLKHPLLKNEKKAQSFEAKRFFYDAYIVYSIAMGDIKECYKYAKQGVKLYLSNSERIRNDTVSNFLISLNNLLVTCNLLKKYDEIPYYLNKLSETKRLITTEHDKVQAFYYSYHELEYHISTGQFTQGAEAAATVAEKLNEYENKLSHKEKIILYVNIAILYFGNENYHDCILFLNKIRNEPKLKTRPDIDYFISIFYIMAHYEIVSAEAHSRPEELMNYLTRSSSRFLLRRKRMYRFEKTLLDFFGKKLSKANSQKEIATCFKGLKTEIEILAKEPFEKNILGYFDFISWADSKIENRPFEKIAKEKAKMR